jgi:ribosomal protein S18 acetylase RimI-like enzyme
MTTDSTPADARWTLRELTASDQDFLWEMEYLALWDPPTEPRRPRTVLELPHIRRLVENWGREADFGLVAITSKTAQPVGAIWARLDGYDSLENYGCPYPALGIAVVPEHQGQGAGSFLLAPFIAALRQRVDGLRLGVHPKNTLARRLYEKFGFTEYAVGAGDYPQMKLDFS